MDNSLIKRHDAIDAIDRERKNKHLFNTAEDGLLEARGIINTLPSAEPEIVRCKDCVFRRDDHCDYVDFWLQDDYFCSRGERKDG